MSNFKGYEIKCNGCTFQNPAMKREGYKFAPRLISVADATTTADGALTMKVLPHERRKIWCSFPPMTPEQFRIYYKALRMDLSGAQNMALLIEAYNDGEDRYEEDTYYHTDIVYYPVIYQGQRMIQIEDFELIGH